MTKVEVPVKSLYHKNPPWLPPSICSEAQKLPAVSLNKARESLKGLAFHEKKNLKKKQQISNRKRRKEKVDIGSHSKSQNLNAKDTSKTLCNAKYTRKIPMLNGGLLLAHPAYYYRE